MPCDAMFCLICSSSTQASPETEKLKPLRTDLISFFIPLKMSSSGQIYVKDGLFQISQPCACPMH